MNVIKIAPRGFCKGVIRAIQIVQDTKKNFPDDEIFILGQLVHNQYVKDALYEMGIHVLEDPSKTREELLLSVPKGSIIIFSAHGVSEALKGMANSIAKQCIDASCPDVIRTQDLIKAKIKEKYHILYIGKAHHPEAQAIQSIDDQIDIVENLHDIEKIEVKDKLFVCNQTTMSIDFIEESFLAIKKRFPHAIFSEEVCSATRLRQRAIQELNDCVDLLYVIGDKASNNSNQLVKIAIEKGIQKVYLISDVNGVSEKHLKDVHTIAVSAGASTPSYLSEQVITYLQDYELDNKKPRIEIKKILQ